MHRRIRQPILPNRGRKWTKHDRWGRTDRQRSGLAATSAAHSFQRALVLRRDRPRFVEKQPAGIRQRGPALRSNEDRAAKLPFEFLYLLRERRLRHPEERRSTAEVQLFGDRDEIT